MSFVSDIAALDFENFFLFNEGTYNSVQAYKNSKVAGVMFTYELARRLEGTGVTVNALTPGRCHHRQLVTLLVNDKLVT